MRFPRTRSTVLRVTLVAAFVLAFAATPAFAVDTTGLVPNDCSVGGRSILNWSAESARARIAAVTKVPDLAPLTFAANGETFTLEPETVVEIDVDRMLESAYDGSCTGGKEIPVAYAWDKDALKAWVVSVAGGVDKDARNAKYQLKSGKIKVKGSANGRALDRVKARAAVRTAVRAALASPDSKLVSSAFEVDTVKPKVTKKKLGKVLLVDLSQRKIRLYSKGKLEKTYRCAVGMRGYSTPTGSFKIVRKVKWPTWGNPGSAWAKNMPSYIGPGPSNPLGTRALYLNVSGIRIHGTSKRSSIGTAASHGCMRMLREDVEELYKKVPVGTKVHIVK